MCLLFFKITTQHLVIRYKHLYVLQIIVLLRSLYAGYFLLWQLTFTLKVQLMHCQMNKTKNSTFKVFKIMFLSEN